MLKKLLFCEVCGRVVEHVVDGDGDGEDGGALALCTLCGRLSSVPTDTDEHALRRGAPPPCNSGCR